MHHECHHASYFYLDFFLRYFWGGDNERRSQRHQMGPVRVGTERNKTRLGGRGPSSHRWRSSQLWRRVCVVVARGTEFRCELNICFSQHLRLHCTHMQSDECDLSEVGVWVLCEAFCRQPGLDRVRAKR